MMKQRQGAMATLRQASVTPFQQDHPELLAIPDDREAMLIDLARHDPHAFAPLYERYFSQIFGYCLNRTHHREIAADLTAQTFTRAITGLPRYRPKHGTTFRSWLFTIAHNLVIDHSRRTRQHESLDLASDENANLDWWYDPAPGPEDLAIANDERQWIRQVLDRLPERQRSIVELRMAGLRGTEIAGVMGMTHAAVKSAQFRAYATLRELFAAGDPTNGDLS